MIVDCHTHVWESVEQLGRGTGLYAPRGRGAVPSPRAEPADHLAAARPVDKTFVLAFKSHYLGAEVPNEYVARYCQQHRGRLLGFGAVDPSRPREAIDELRHISQELGMAGVTIWPAAQDFHPASTGAMRVYAEAVRLGMPVFIHQDVQASAYCRMEFARPYLIDEVAREFPEMKIIISHLGHPWVDETIALLGKHRHVFADISRLVSNAWIAYNALLSAYQAGVMGTLLFGSNFPQTSAAACIESLYSINQFCHGTNMPTLPREQLRQIVERDALKLLGVDSGVPESAPEPKSTVLLDD